MTVPACRGCCARMSGNGPKHPQTQPRTAPVPAPGPASGAGPYDSAEFGQGPYHDRRVQIRLMIFLLQIFGQGRWRRPTRRRRCQADGCRCRQCCRRRSGPTRRAPPPGHRMSCRFLPRRHARMSGNGAVDDSVPEASFLARSHFGI